VNKSPKSAARKFQEVGSLFQGYLFLRELWKVIPNSKTAPIISSLKKIWNTTDGKNSKQLV